MLPVNCHALTRQYIITLLYVNDLENQDIIGVTHLADREKEKRSPVSGQISYSTVYDIDSYFFQHINTTQNSNFNFNTEYFFMKNFIDHIWSIHLSSHQHSLILKERFQSSQARLNQICRINKRGQIFRQKLIRYTKERRNLTWHSCGLRLYKSPNNYYEKKIVSQEWIINQPKPDADDVTLFSSLLHQICIHDDTPSNQQYEQITEAQQSILNPFAHNLLFSHVMMKQKTLYKSYCVENFIFPIDWQKSALTQIPLEVLPMPLANASTSVKVTMFKDQLQVYKYQAEDKLLRKKRTPSTLICYEFITAIGSMDLLIWAKEGEYAPTAWEYREKPPGNRAIRMVLIDDGPHKRNKSCFYSINTPSPKLKASIFNIPEGTRYEKTTAVEMHPTPEQLISPNDEAPPYPSTEALIFTNTAIVASENTARRSHAFPEGDPLLTSVKKEGPTKEIAGNRTTIASVCPEQEIILCPKDKAQKTPVPIPLTETANSSDTATVVLEKEDSPLKTLPQGLPLTIPVTVNSEIELLPHGIVDDRTPFFQLKENSPRSPESDDASIDNKHTGTKL